MSNDTEVLVSSSRLPKDIKQRLVKLRDTDPEDVKNNRYNKTSRYVFFGKDKLDQMTEHEIYHKLRSTYPINDIHLLLEVLLGYSKKRVTKIVTNMISEL